MSLGGNWEYSIFEGENIFVSMLSATVRNVQLNDRYSFALFWWIVIC